MSGKTQLDYDVLVVGGGINGAGIARDAAGRGLRVALCEKDDLASHTSSASTKLIHGGLRYLEHHEFGLVRKALIEREVLLRSAPHIMWPLRFVMPHDAGQRPSWMIRAGMFIYDHLARRELLPASRTVDLRRHEAGGPLKRDFKRGFVYSDGWVDDARLVVLNAVDAAEKGAAVFTRTLCESAVQQDGHWLVSLRSGDGTRELNVRCIVNAAGPWVLQFLQSTAHHSASRAVRLIKGSHIIVRSLFEHSHAYIFQHSDKRIVFAIPYEKEFTLIGTTDIEYRGDAGQVAIDEAEIAYLCELSNHYFSKTITPDDVVWSYSGVRPLVDDEHAEASAVTRDYRFEYHDEGAPLLSIFGGKITTFRKLAEEAVDLISPALGNRCGPWTRDACLPGGDLFATHPENRAVREFARFQSQLQSEYPWLPASLALRYSRAYGTRTRALLDNCTSMVDLGQEIAPGLYAREAAYLVEHEWARSAEDILWRRTKLGLHAPAGGDKRLDDWLAAYRMKKEAAA